MGCKYSYWDDYRRWYRGSGIELYRDPVNGRIAGVCAGIARTFVIRPFFVRLGMIAAGLMIGPFAIFAYIVAAFALPVSTEGGSAEWQREFFTRGRKSKRRRKDRSASGYSRPRVEIDLDGLRERLRGVDKRVAGIEAYVASSEFTLSRAIKNLEE